MHSRYKDIHFNMFSEGIVSPRFYKNAPAADRHIICVAFTYLAPQSGGGTIGQGFTNLRADPALPGVLVLIRRDRSKIYVNPIFHYTPV